MEVDWSEYEYIDEEELAQPDFYVDQFYPAGALQVTWLPSPPSVPITLTTISLRMIWRKKWAEVLLHSRSVRSWSTASSRPFLTVSSTWARS